jgi:F0F1-type ATP synthase membrane subunit b/b'
MADENTIEDLKEMIINWLSLDDKIKEISVTVKDLNNEKKQFESYILDYMTKLNKPTIDTTSGKLIKDEKKTKKALKEEIVTNALAEITGDKLKAAEFTKYIFDKRPEVDSIKLKRMKLPIKGKK